MLTVNAFKSDVKLSFYSGTAQQMGESSVSSNEGFMDAFLKMLFHPKITSQSRSRTSALHHLDNFMVRALTLSMHCCCLVGRVI